MISKEDYPNILQDFPNLKLCYELIKHKIYTNETNIILAIPEGNKCIAWFTSYKEDNVCFILEININTEDVNINNIINIDIVLTSFSDQIAFGTIFYGTVFKIENNKIENNKNNKIENSSINNVKYFCIEDLYYYKSKLVVNLPYMNKLNILKDAFINDISQYALTNNYMIFGLPLLSNNYDELLKQIPLLPYNITDIKIRYTDKHLAKKIENIKYKTINSNKINTNAINTNTINTNTINTNKINTSQNTNTNPVYAIFRVNADIEPDIYNLYVLNNGNYEFYDNALISNYKISVMMNKLFRNIKENDDLDLMQESDDEFEDNREDKYVYLNRTFNIKCGYNIKFKKWYPICLADENSNIASFKKQ
jgi:hypothetical protein